MEEGEELDDRDVDDDGDDGEADDEAVVDMADDGDDDVDVDVDDDGYIVTADGLATMVNATTSRGNRTSTGTNTTFLSIAMHPINTTTTYQQGLTHSRLLFQIHRRNSNRRRGRG